MSTWFNLVALPDLARIFLVVLFPFSGLDKIIHWKAARRQAAEMPLGDARILLLAAIAIELITPICIVAGRYDRPAALLLAVFCVATAVLYHQFWRFGDFWAQGESVSRNHFWDFLKNFGLVGGLIFVMLGAAPAHWQHDAPLHPTALATPYSASPSSH